MRCCYQKCALRTAAALTVEEMGSGGGPWIVLGPGKRWPWGKCQHPWGLSGIMSVVLWSSWSLLGEFSGMGMGVLILSGHRASKQKRGLVSEGHIMHVLHLGVPGQMPH